MAHVRGVDRQATTILPARLDDWVEADHIVRVIDAWIDRLDLAALGFAHAAVGPRGRPPYAPADLLKLYLYGYPHQVRTSRRLERECRRNIEVMWLLRRLALDHKTIAHFRRTHTDAPAAVCATFVDFARRRQIDADLIAIDGTKVRAVASERAVTNPAKRHERQAALCKAIEDYLLNLDTADAADGGPSAEQASPLRQTLAELEQERTRVRGQTNQLAASGRADYSNVVQLKTCEVEGIPAYLPVQRSVNPGGPRLYPKPAFAYEAGVDRYVCPQGHALEHHQILRKKRMVIYTVRPRYRQRKPANRHDSTKAKRPSTAGAFGTWQAQSA